MAYELTDRMRKSLERLSDDDNLSPHEQASIRMARARIAELERELAGRPAPLVWTSKPPTEDGEYLLKPMDRGMTPALVWLAAGDYVNRPIAGPIPEPAEPQP